MQPDAAERLIRNAHLIWSTRLLLRRARRVQGTTRLCLDRTSEHIAASTAALEKSDDLLNRVWGCYVPLRLPGKRDEPEN